MNRTTKQRSWSDLDILCLRLLPRMTSRLFASALQSADSFEEFVLGPSWHAAMHGRQQRLFDVVDLVAIRDECKRQLDRCALADVRIVSVADERYPALLRHISYPPNVLFVRGTLREPDAVSLGVVGTRQCTQYGQAVTKLFCSECASAGLIITSGLAAGIDSFAHRAALDAGGVTYAVIASGIDRISPAPASRLARSISDSGGAVISEYACGVNALPPFFPQRNRIISGISTAVLVVESGERGGSLITARFAVDQSRSVFAVPGMINAPRSKGTNALIASNSATAAVSSHQLLEEMGFAHTPRPSSRPEFSSPLEETVYGCIQHEPLHIDTLTERIDAAAGDLLVCALMLEFKGYVQQLPGRFFVRTMG